MGDGGVGDGEEEMVSEYRGGMHSHVVKTSAPP